MAYCAVPLTFDGVSRRGTDLPIRRKSLRSLSSFGSMGGSRRSLGDYAAECALIAKEVRRPVKLIWTREEDIAQGMFRPQSFQCLEAATDASGKVTGWKHCVV